MLQAGSKGDSKKNGDLEVAVQYSGPAVLPWLWQPVQSDGEIVLLPQAIPHIAGTSGKPQDPASAAGPYLYIKLCLPGYIALVMGCKDHEDAHPAPAARMGLTALQARFFWCADQLAQKIPVIRSRMRQEARRCQTRQSQALALLCKAVPS